MRESGVWVCVKVCVCARFSASNSKQYALPTTPGTPLSQAKLDHSTATASWWGMRLFSDDQRNLGSLNVVAHDCVYLLYEPERHSKWR